MKTGSREGREESNSLEEEDGEVEEEERGSEEEDRNTEREAAGSYSLTVCRACDCFASLPPASPHHHTLTHTHTHLFLSLRRT